LAIRDVLCVRGATLLCGADPTPSGITIVVVDEDGRPLGVVLDTKRSRASRASGRIPQSAWHPSMLGSLEDGVCAEDLMEESPPTVPEQETIGEVASRFVATGVTEAIVVDADGRVVGAIDREDLAAARPRLTQRRLRGERVLRHRAE